MSFAVLDFEPNNITAKEFYPLIEGKLRRKYPIRTIYFCGSSALFSVQFLFAVLEERSSSDEENSNNVLSTPDYEEDIENKETPTIFGIELNANEIENAHTNSGEFDEASSNESDSDFADNQSDVDDQSVDSFNESDASANHRNEYVSESTTHSYSNSLLEDEDDDANDVNDVNDDDSDDEAVNSTHHKLSDLNNGEIGAGGVE